MKIKSFRVKCTIIIILLMIIPLVISDGVLGMTMFNEIRSNVYTNQMDNVQSINNKSTDVLTDVQNIVNSLVASTEVKSMNFDTMDSYLKEVIGENSILSDSSVIAPNGMQIYNSQGKDKLSSRSDRDYFKAGMTGKAGFSDVLISKTTNKPIIVCYAPIKQNGTIIGVLTVNVSLDKFSGIVSSTLSGEAGQAYIVDNTGKVIANSNKQAIKSMTDLSKNLPVSNVKKNETGHLEYINGGNRVLATYTPITKVNWGIVMEVPTTIAYKALTNFEIEFVIILILALVVAIIASLYIGKYITDPLKKILNKLKIAATGELNSSLIEDSLLKREDEFGEIAKGYNLMIESISSLIKKIKDSTETVVDSSKSLEDIVRDVTGSTGEVATAVGEIAKGAESQSEQTEEGVREVDELSSKLEQLSNTTENIRETSVKANNKSDSGLEVVDLLMEKTSENNKASDKVNTSIENVNNSVNRINIIIESIEDIAEQTNLLALNAAIEAARAGEAGKGFSVVAEEVRTLSEESSAAAEEVRKLISEVQVQSSIAVESIETSRKIVTEQNDAVDKTRDFFKDISNLIKELDGKINEIVEYSSVMSSKKEHIVSVITNIAAAAQESSAATEEVSASTEEQLSSMERVSGYVDSLNKLANELEEEINKFTV